MQGKRKLIIAILSIIVYGLVLVYGKAIDPFSLGIGLASVLGTVMYGYHQEYKNKEK